MIVSPGRLVGRFLGIFVLVYVPLIIPWPALTDGYAKGFRAAGEMVLGSFGAHGEVRFKPSLIKDGEWDTALILGNRRTKAGTQLDIDARELGYKPTVFVVALFIATPYPLRRRFRLLVVGVVLTQAYVAFRVLLILLYAFGDSRTKLAFFELGPFSMKTVAMLLAILDALPLAGTFVLPALIWGSVAFRRSDLANFREKLGISPRANAASGS